MTMLDELNRCIEAIKQAEGYPIATQIDRARDLCMFFIRKDGQALVDCVDRAMRYEAVRKMNPPMFQSVFNENVRTGVPFDQLIDVWAFNHGYPSPLDAARAK